MSVLTPNDNQSYNERGYSYLIIIGVVLMLIYCFCFGTFYISELFSNTKVFFREFAIRNGSVPYLMVSLMAIFSHVFFLQQKEKRYVDYFDWLFLGYACWGTLSILWSTNVNNAIGASCLIWCPFLFYQLFKNVYAKEEELINNLFGTILPIGVIIITLSYFIHNSDLIALLGNSEITYRGLGNNAQTILGDKKLSSTFICILLPIMLVLFRKRKISELAIYAILLSIFLILILGYRAVYFVSLVFFILLLIISRPQMKRLILLLILGGIVLLVYFQFVNFSDFTKSLGRNPISQRMIIWGKSFDLFCQNPFLGVGLGNWDNHKHTLKLAKVTHPYNDYLRHLIELGFLGLSLYISMLITLVYRSLKLLWSTNNRNDKAMYALFLGAVINYMILAFLDGIIFRLNHQIMFMILCAIINVQYFEIFTSEAHKTEQKPLTILIIAVAGILLSYVLFF